MLRNQCSHFFDAIYEVLKPHLDFYELVERDRKVEPSSCSLLLANDKTGVEISYEPLEGGSFVRLSILDEGRFPKYPLFIDENTELRTFDLQDIRTVRGERPFLDRSTDVVQLARAAANALLESGRNVLLGKFEELAGARGIVRARARALRDAGRQD